MPKLPGAGRKAGVTKAEIERRVGIVYELSLQGYSPTALLRLIVDNRAKKGDPKKGHEYRQELDWDVRISQIQHYFKLAADRLRGEALEDGVTLYRRSIKRREDLLRLARSKGDLTNVRATLNDLDRLTGVNSFDHGAQTPKGEQVQRPAIELPGGLTLEI